MKKISILLLTTALLASCGTVSKSSGGRTSSVSFGSSGAKERTQVLTFNITPATANCVLYRSSDGEIGFVTPAANKITVEQGPRDIVVTCKAPGYKDKIVTLASAGLSSGLLIDWGLVADKFAYASQTTITLEP